MKKKYNTKFPFARIKKIMQKDEEVGKVAAATPVIISKALELFLQDILEKTALCTRDSGAKTMMPGHLKEAIATTQEFDFLKDVVQSVQDLPEKKASKKRKADDHVEKDPAVTPKQRGRPKKSPMPEVKHEVRIAPSPVPGTGLYPQQRPMAMKQEHGKPVNSPPLGMRAELVPPMGMRQEYGQPMGMMQDHGPPMVIRQNHGTSVVTRHEHMFIQNPPPGMAMKQEHGYMQPAGLQAPAYHRQPSISRHSPTMLSSPSMHAHPHPSAQSYRSTASPQPSRDPAGPGYWHQESNTSPSPLHQPWR